MCSLYPFLRPRFFTYKFVVCYEFCSNCQCKNENKELNNNTPSEGCFFFFAGVKCELVEVINPEAGSLFGGFDFMHFSAFVLFSITASERNITKLQPGLFSFL